MILDETCSLATGQPFRWQGSPVAKAERGVCGVQTYRFRALVTLHAEVPVVPASHWPSGGHMVMVQACELGQQGSYRDFPGALCRDDELPLRPGEQAVVTVTVADDAAIRFFSPGQSFTLWAGSDIGHGVVSRRVFAPSGPS